MAELLRRTAFRCTSRKRSIQSEIEIMLRKIRAKSSVMVDRVSLIYIFIQKAWEFRLLLLRGGEGIRTPINSLTAGVICRRTHGRSATPPQLLVLFQLII